MKIIHKGFVVDKGALEQCFFSEHFRIPSSRSFLILSIHIFHTVVMEAIGI
jgi:hypothetical protein